jgi:hypothetical protein
VSHLPERQEKTCLNCQAAVHGRYCHVCGQENIEPKESFWHLITHFFYDITHFDGKFFSTLRYLLFKPGFLSHEYLKGKRASYLHPIRMYVFTSAFFFLVFFSATKEEEGVLKVNDATDQSAASIIKKLEKKKKNIVDVIDEDTSSVVGKQIMVSTLANIDSDLALIRRDTTAKKKLRTIKNSEYNFLAGTAGNKYKTIKSYDSAQAVMPEDKRDNWLERRFTHQNLRLREKYNNDGKAIWKAIIEKFNHLFPQMLFVSLPLFALMLQLLYVRRRKFYYVNHVIFTIHMYCGTFIVILTAMAVSGIFGWFGAELPSVLKLLFVLTGSFYWYKSMRNFYEQRRGKTILKYALVLFMSLIVMTFIFAGFFIFSAMSI